jgi:hypothetical protein
MSNSSAIIIGGKTPQTYWNGIADFGLLLAIDELREQVFAVIKAGLPEQPQQPHDELNEVLDFGRRS